MRKIKLISFLLVILMLLATATSCNVGGGGEDNDKDKDKDKDPGNGWATDENGNYLDDVPADLRFDGETFTLFAPKPWSISIIYDAEKIGDERGGVGDALYNRKMYLNDRYGIEYEVYEGDSWTHNQFTYIINSVMTQDKFFDVASRSIRSATAPRSS